MGSTGHYIGTDWSWNGNTKEYIDKTINSVGVTHTWRVLHSETKGSVYYAAVERTHHATGDRIVFAVVQPYSFYGKGWNRELIVKDQDETSGPYDCQASAKLLNLLTPTDYEHANRWRADCRANLAKKKEKVNIEVGDILVFEEPFTFSHWGTADTFRVTEWGKRKRFVALDDEGNRLFPCRLTRRAMQFPFIVEKVDNAVTV